MASFLAKKMLVKAILEHATVFNWSLQGFGMLRLHLSDEIRLNVWDRRYRVPNVSLIHNHPWNFESTVIAGSLHNVRYCSGTTPYSFGLIKPGPGGGLLQELGIVNLDNCFPEIYREGDSYTQYHDEIHISQPTDGTVTLNLRTRVGEDTAHVYWPSGTDWVSAEPRKATDAEVNDITGAALRRWFHQ